MKTSEFKEQIESLGYILDNNKDSKVLTICDSSSIVAEISNGHRYIVDFSWSGFHKLSDGAQDTLVRRVIEYVSTPIEERNDVQRYYIDILKNADPDTSPLGAERFITVDRDTDFCFISDGYAKDDMKNQFTKNEAIELDPAFESLLVKVEDVEQ